MASPGASWAFVSLAWLLAILVATEGRAVADVLPRDITVNKARFLQEKSSRISSSGNNRLIIGVPVAAHQIDFAKNWFISVERLGYASKVLFLSEDATAYASLRAKWPNRTLLVESGLFRPQNSTSQEVIKKLDPADANVWKPWVATYLLALLRFGFTVFLNSPYSLWVQDPFLFLPIRFHIVLTQQDATAPLKAPPKTRRRWRRYMFSGVTHKLVHEGKLSGSMMLVRPTAAAERIISLWKRNLVKAAESRATLDPGGELLRTLRRATSQVTKVELSPPQQHKRIARNPLFTRHRHALAENRLHGNLSIPGSMKVLLAGSAVKAAIIQANPALPRHLRRSVLQHQGLWFLPTDKQSITRVAEGMVSQDRLIILVTVAGNFFDLLLNWFISVRRFGFGDKVLFVAEDLAAYRFLIKQWPQQTAFVHRAGGSLKPGRAEKFGTDYYYSLVDRRQSYIRELLDLELTVLFSDVDMVWLKNPFPHLQRSYDVLIMNDGWKFQDHSRMFPGGSIASFHAGFEGQGCGCFILFRPTSASKRLVRVWQEDIARKVKITGRFVNDQKALNAVIRGGGARLAKVGVLPSQLFPSGCMFFGVPMRCKRQRALFHAAAKAGEADPVVVHANWMINHSTKVRELQKHALWFLPPQSRAKRN